MTGVESENEMGSSKKDSGVKVMCSPMDQRNNSMRTRLGLSSHNPRCPPIPVLRYTRAPRRGRSPDKVNRSVKRALNRILSVLLFELQLHRFFCFSTLESL